MAGRSNTELKVFLNGSLADYRTFCENPNDPNAKLGSVFFDRDNKAVYVEGVLASSNVKEITYVGTLLTITLIDGTTFPIELSVEDDLNTLKTTLEKWVGDNYVKQVAGSRLMTDAEGTKLAGIDEGAQTNRYVTVNGDVLGLDTEYNKSTIKISGNLVTAPNNGEDSEVEFNLSMWHDSTNNKIYFFNLPNEQANSTNVDKALFIIDTADFVRDSFVKSVTFNPNTNDLEILFVLADGTEKPVNVELDTLMNVYKAGNGIVLDGDTFKLSLGDGVKVEGGSLTLSLGNGLAFDDSGNLKVDFASNSVTSINSMGGGSYTIMSEGKKVGTNANELKPIEVITDSAAKKIKINAKPAHMLAQFFHENNADATSGIRAKGVKITEDANGNPYSMLMDFTPKVWSF